MKRVEIQIRSIAALLAICSCVPMNGYSVNGQQRETRPETVTRSGDQGPAVDFAVGSGSNLIFVGLTGLLAEELIEKIGASSMPVQFANDNEAPVTINAASVRVVERDDNKGIIDHGSSWDHPKHVVEASITLFNNTDERIKGVALTFMDKHNKPGYQPVSILTEIDGRSSLTIQKRQEEFSSYWIGRPEQLLVKVAGVCFEDFSTWGIPPNFSDGPPPKVVDMPPEILTPAQPRYTPDARANRIEGTVRVRVLVGADGRVKDVEIIKALDDDLDDEAEFAVREMQFKPAFKSGVAVSYWVEIDVEFKLD